MIAFENIFLHVNKDLRLLFIFIPQPKKLYQLCRTVQNLNYGSGF